MTKKNHAGQGIGSLIVAATAALSSILGIAADSPVVLGGSESGFTQGEVYFMAGIVILTVASLGTIWHHQVRRFIPIYKWGWLMRRMVTSKTWQLYFDPGTGTSKEIEFNPDGKITRSPNANESTWRLRDAQLEILRADGNVHNRFKWHNSDARFQSTNEPDTHAIKTGHRGQYLTPI